MGVGEGNLSHYPDYPHERKLVIAWYLRSKTVIDRASVSEMLCMGHPSTVSRAVTLVNQSNSKAIREMKKLLVLEK